MSSHPGSTLNDAIELALFLKRENIRPEQVLVRTKTDPHSLQRWRVNGILPHIDAWYDVFGVKHGDKMYLAPEKRTRLW